jgi:hypothetical protein
VVLAAELKRAWAMRFEYGTSGKDAVRRTSF